MLSGESAIGSYGQKALSILQMTSSRMEIWSREENQQILKQQELGISLPDRVTEQICNSAVDIGTLTYPINSSHFLSYAKTTREWIPM